MRRRKSTAQVLREASPGLTVIPGGVYPHRRRKKAVKLNELPEIEMPVYIPHQSNPGDWKNAGGVNCPVCGKEVVKLLPYGSLGLLKGCPECIAIRRSIVEHKLRLIQLREQAEVERRRKLRLPI